MGWLTWWCFVGYYEGEDPTERVAVKTLYTYGLEGQPSASAEMREISPGGNPREPLKRGFCCLDIRCLMGYYERVSSFYEMFYSMPLGKAGALA